MPEEITTPITEEPVRHILNIPIEDEMKKAYLDYAMSVIISRALPDVRDGLKPVHRRIVYAAHDVGIHYGSKFKKFATLVGEVMGKYHPHGDGAIYQALVRMAQPFSARYTLIDGQGNFGNIDGDMAAAMRYTECRLDKITDLLLKDIDANTVDFVPNYSVEILEPTVLPAIIPNLLANGSSGIAVGMATNIPPHNLKELINGVIFILEQSEVIQDELKDVVIDIYNVKKDIIKVSNWKVQNEVALEELIKYIKGPDFPSGCTIYDQSEILKYFATGRGKIVIRADVNIEEGKGGKNVIIVTEIPYGVNRSDLIEKIANLVKDKKIDGISEIRNESAKGATRIVIELKRDANAQKVLNYLYKHTPLQDSFSVNMLALVDGEPQLIGVKTYITEFIKHRKIVVERRTINYLIKAKEREHILEGLKKAIDFIDEVIAIIRSSADTDTAKAKLIERFEFTEIQAQAILDMQLKRLAALEREKIEDELNELAAKIKEYLQLLETPALMIAVIKDELTQASTAFGDARRTKIIKGKVGELSDEDLEVEEETLITITKTGYIKRLKPSIYKAQQRGGKGVVGIKTKDEDEVASLKLANTHDKILFFTSKGRAFEKSVYEIPESSRNAKGTSLVNIIELTGNEKVVSTITINKADKDKELYILIGTKRGTIKKTAISSYVNIQKRGVTAISLDDNDEIVNITNTTGDDDIMIVTKQGKAIRFNEKDSRPQGRNTKGVRGIKIKSSDQVVAMEAISKDVPKTARLATIMEKGYGKSTLLSEFTAQKRGGTGVITAKITPKTGTIKSAVLINDADEDLIITTESGQVIRIKTSQIPTTARATQGVILMRLGTTDKVSAISIFNQEEKDLANAVDQEA